MKRSIYILLLLGIVSCGSNDNQMRKYDFVGRWNWTNTDGGIGFHIHKTPETIGKNIQLKLEGNKTYSIIVDEEEVEKGDYKLSMEKSIYSGKSEQFIELLGARQNLGIVTKGIIKVSEAKELHISDNIHDGVGSKFVRIE